MNQPDSTYLTEKLDLTIPLIGVYDTPDVEAFPNVVSPVKGRHACLFSWFNQWQQGTWLRLSPDNFGCGGAGFYWFSKETRSREKFVEFLCDDEGLKGSHDNMNAWIDQTKTYHPEYENLIVGPLVPEQYQHLKTVTFFVNPDQLSNLVVGAQYFQHPEDGAPLKVEFGSGCSQLLTKVATADHPMATIGALDSAMRRFLPRDILAFTVSREKFEELCRLDDDSFLNRPFIETLRKARNGSLAS